MTRTARTWPLLLAIGLVFGGCLALIIGYLMYGFPP
jgi:hypothetical protein